MTLEPEVVLIIVLFGGILTVMLYKYLFGSPEYKGTGKYTEQQQEQDEVSDSVLEAIAEKLYILFQEVEALEKTVDNLEFYLKQKVETWKKREKGR
jgi:uncharacterized protein YlxW (UPF0749 family)